MGIHYWKVAEQINTISELFTLGTHVVVYAESRALPKGSWKLFEGIPEWTGVVVGMPHGRSDTENALNIMPDEPQGSGAFVTRHPRFIPLDEEPLEGVENMVARYSVRLRDAVGSIALNAS